MKKKTKAAVLINFALCLILSGILCAETQISPTNPTTSDVIGILVSGEWPNGCVPNVSFVSVSGDEIHFQVYDDYPPDIVCALEVTYWELYEFVGPLSRGTYTIYAYHLMGGDVSDPYIFVVSSEPQIFAPGDFDEDGEVNCDDLRVLALAFMSKSGDDNWNPDCDISDPNDEVIDGQDFGVFAMDWDGCGDPPPEPAMSYNIEDCDSAKAAGPDKDALRFSTTVDGNYILFEDMMYANCCPDEMWLDMEITDNQITIYEHAEGGLCDCMCDWPITATLGPFAPGTYTLEVYEDIGGFIGSTIVIIP
jgi:hypothetical protein